MEFLDANSSDGNVDTRIMCDVGHTCDKDTTGKRDEFFIVYREPAPDSSRLRRNLARILLCDATTVAVMFSSLVARPSA